VELHLEAERVELGDVALERLRLDEADAAVGGRAAVGPEVRLEAYSSPMTRRLADAARHYGLAVVELA
jgi:hypothetical protein